MWKRVSELVVYREGSAFQSAREYLQRRHLGGLAQILSLDSVDWERTLLG